MECLSINLNSVFKILLSSAECLVPPRKHRMRRTESYIIYFVTNGKLTMKQNGKSLELDKGDIYIFDKNEMHAPDQATDCEYFYIHYECEAEWFECSKAEFLEVVENRNEKFSGYDVLDLERYKHFEAYVPRCIHIDNIDIFKYLVDKFKKLRLIYGGNNDIEHRLAISQGVASLFLKLESIAVNNYLVGVKGVYLHNTLAVKRISDFIETNFQKNFTSEDIEKQFSLSYDYANRIFKQQKGVSIISYRNKLRIEKAKVLLITTDKSMEEISDEVGFGDRYYFSKFFKKAVGVSPMCFKRGEYIAF